MTQSILSTFPEGDADNSAECTVCQAYGACRDWIETMADDAEVPAEWLAGKVKSLEIDYDYGVHEVEDLYYQEHHTDLETHE